jgi:hypothetical protein
LLAILPPNVANNKLTQKQTTWDYHVSGPLQQEDGRKISGRSAANGRGKPVRFSLMKTDDI